VPTDVTVTTVGGKLQFNHPSGQLTLTRAHDLRLLGFETGQSAPKQLTAESQPYPGAIRTTFVLTVGGEKFVVRVDSANTSPADLSGALGAALANAGVSNVTVDFVGNKLRLKHPTAQLTVGDGTGVAVASGLDSTTTDALQPLIMAVNTKVTMRDQSTDPQEKERLTNEVQTAAARKPLERDEHDEQGDPGRAACAAEHRPRLDAVPPVRRPRRRPPVGGMSRALSSRPTRTEAC